MAYRILASMLLAVAAFVAVPVPAAAQGTYGMPLPATTAGPSQDELDALIAPIALYPDQLLSQILMAATFPEDVLDAARFVRDNPGLTGAALDDAVADRNWDPSVMSLTAFPQVLDMMAQHIEWTERLGDAFYNDEYWVMQTVQSLRARAYETGTLRSTPQQTVTYDERAIYIEPARPEIVYVPVYDPTVIYGTWWAPAYRPFFWRPPRVYAPTVIVDRGISFGIGVAPTYNHWGWARPDWRRRYIIIDTTRRNNFIERRPQYREELRDGRWARRPDPSRRMQPVRPSGPETRPAAPQVMPSPVPGREPPRPAPQRPQPYRDATPGPGGSFSGPGAPPPRGNGRPGGAPPPAMGGMQGSGSTPYIAPPSRPSPPQQMAPQPRPAPQRSEPPSTGGPGAGPAPAPSPQKGAPPRKDNDNPPRKDGPSRDRGGATPHGPQGDAGRAGP